MRKGKRSAKIFVGAALLCFVVVSVAGAPLLAGCAPDAADSAQRLESFSALHPFGTDRFGRDIFSRTLYGGRVTLVSSFAALEIGRAHV